MSARTLGTTLNVSEAEAQGYIDVLFGQFPDLEKFIEANSCYPMQHNGYINTELGDTLDVPLTDFYIKMIPTEKAKRK